MKGNIKGLLENIIGSTNLDKDRYLKIYEKLFKDGKLEKND